MKIDTENIEILSPKNQLQLFGYDDYFNSFIKLFHKNKLPNTILLSGLKGSGKATFAYHFINYLLSYKEQNKYSTNNFTIHPDNKSYKSLCYNTHPNFFSLENNVLEESIKIDNVRDVLRFLNKSTYYSNIKIILIDDAEYLNVHSSNALLHALEEPKNNTFFFIIHNSANKILDTIKSRCIEFKFFLTSSEKKSILGNIIQQYKNDLNIKKIDDYYYFDTPGNILKYLKILDDSNVDYAKDKLSFISYLINKYKQKKDSQLLIFITLMIELLYKELSLKNNKKLNIYFYNKFNILKQINEMKKFNLDKNNLFISLQETLKNES